MPPTAPPNDGRPHRVALRLLGAPRLLAPSGAHPLSAKDAALLLLLALRGPLPRAWLAGLLWPGRPVETGLGSLRQRGFKLRQVAGTPVLEGSGPSLALAPDVVHDLADPREGLRADPGFAAEPLLGELRFDDSPELATQVEAERARWAGRVQDALAELAAAGEREGRIAEALRHAERLCRAEPLREHGVRLLMRLHHRRGDRAAALQAFDRLKQALYDELGETPAEETAALAVEIARGQVAGAPARRVLPTALRHPPRTVGRDEILADAEARWAELGVVLLTGAPGIGKTRVLDELVQRLRVAAVCRLYPGDQATELMGLSRVAAVWRRVAPPSESDALLGWLETPHAGPVPGGGLDVERLTRRLERAFAAAPDDLTIAVDDLHFADPTSLAVLAAIASRRRAGARWLLTSRDAPLPAALAGWVDGCDDEADPQVALGALRESALGELLASVDAPALAAAPWRRALYAHCGGHPLAVIQVLRALHESEALTAPAPPAQLPVPSDVLHRVARRLDRGDPRAQQLAFVAALAGGDFDAALAARLLGCSATDLLVPWRQLESAGVLRGDVFSHDLMRQAVLDTVPAALAPAIHRDIAAALADVPGAAARRARHWEAGQAWRQAAEETLRAADEALAAGLERAARDRLLHAATLFERAGAADAAFDARCAAAATTRNAVSPREALDAARALLAAAPTPARRARALCALADALAEEHDEEALPVAEEAVALAERAADAPLAAAARLRLAKAVRLSATGCAEALAIVEPLLAPDAVPLAPHDAREAAALHALLLAGTGQRRRAVTLLRAQWRHATAAGDEVRGCDLASLLALELAYLGRVAEAHALLQPMLERARRAGVEESSVLLDEMNVASFATDLGRFDEAIAACERAVAGMQGSGRLGWRMAAENLLATVFALCGRVDLALHRIADNPPDAPTWARALRRGSQARVGLARGEAPLAGLREAAAMLDAGGVLFAPYIRERIELELARWGPPDAAAARAAQSRVWAREQQHDGLERMAAWLEIEAASRLGDVARAAALADALDAEVAGDWQLYNVYRPELWCTLCRAWDAAGTPQRAQALASRGADWIEDTARRHVPALFRDGFLRRNRFNAELLARAGRG